jgi:hypothetical protein
MKVGGRLTPWREGSLNGPSEMMPSASLSQMVEPGRLLVAADEMAARSDVDPSQAVIAVLAAHAALEALVNQLGGEEIASFNYRARFLPKWHDLCERTLGRQLKAAPDLEHLQALRDAALGFRGEPERLDRRSTTPPPEIKAGVGSVQARWAVEAARRVIGEFYGASGRELPDWM